MKIKLLDFWLSLQDLLMGRCSFLYQLTFMLGIFNFIIGIIVSCTVRNVYPWHIAGGILISLLGIAGVLTAVVPYRRIKAYLDVVSASVIAYGCWALVTYGALRQMSLALVVSYSFIYIWMWILEGIEYARSSKLHD